MQLKHPNEHFAYSPIILASWLVRVNFSKHAGLFYQAGVPKLGQRGEVQVLMVKAFVGSNPTPCISVAPLAVLLHLKKLGHKESTLLSIGKNSDT